MNKYTRKSIADDLDKYDVLAKENDFKEITEWHNGEGYDIAINDTYIHLTHGQLEEINYLIKTLDFE